MAKAALDRAAESGAKLLINEINLGEVYYVLARELSEDAAAYFYYERLPLLPIEVFSNSIETVIAAAELKTGTGLHYLNCFAAVTARESSTPLLTADRDFKRVEGEIKIKWLR